ncbi:hypothetical protein D0Y83_05030 [Qipengyuania flava]|uniref:Uncharacterized protein n=1 Tax=Qipengyuania flava TaxID=192812 RepID=A0A5P6N9K9_9SPHN|nr:hypothetical protein [Qipengyuania flava]QFI62707.1 hypothetical protein D0Y83_05030 [Qipengyuania flava]
MLEAIDLSPTVLDPIGEIAIALRYGPVFERLVKVEEAPARFSKLRFALLDLGLLSLACFVRGVENLLQQRFKLVIGEDAFSELGHDQLVQLLCSDIRA